MADTKHLSVSQVWQPIPTYIVDDKGDFTQASAVFSSGLFHVIPFIPKSQENWLNEALEDFKAKYPPGSNHVIVSCTDRIRSKYPPEKIATIIKELITQKTRWDIAYLYTMQNDCEVSSDTNIAWKLIDNNTITPLVFLFTPQFVKHFGTYKPTILVATNNLMNFDSQGMDNKCEMCKLPSPEQAEKVPQSPNSNRSIAQAAVYNLLPRLIIAIAVGVGLYYAYAQKLIPFSWLVALSIVLVLIIFLL